MSNADDGLPPRAPRSEPTVMRAAAADAALPPHPLDKRWFVHVDGKNYGPYSGHEIKRMIGEGQVQESDFFCVEGAQAWVQAKNEPLLGVMFRTQAKAPPPPTITATAEGGTIVQVTNNIPNQAANLAQAALLLSGEAASKSPGVALLLSFFISGAGQMYNGQVGKGILMLLGTIILWFVLLGWTVWIWSMIDAYQTAKRMNLAFQQRILAGMM
ncbi:MAG TPA: GYF domain-containing protein [Pseudolabrys sp.]|nr:GYF domain-containing protein [Pseudolabrys sp.]